jgi:hypothetical protein
MGFVVVGRYVLQGSARQTVSVWMAGRISLFKQRAGFWESIGAKQPGDIGTLWLFSPQESFGQDLLLVRRGSLTD